MPTPTLNKIHLLKTKKIHNEEINFIEMTCIIKIRGFCIRKKKKFDIKTCCA